MAKRVKIQPTPEEEKILRMLNNGRVMRFSGKDVCIGSVPVGPAIVGVSLKMRGYVAFKSEGTYSISKKGREALALCPELNVPKVELEKDSRFGVVAHDPNWADSPLHAKHKKQMEKAQAKRKVYGEIYGAGSKVLAAKEA